MTYVLVTPEQFEAFKQEALAWVESNTLFNDVPGIAWTAIAEFNANKAGLTLYAYRVGVQSHFSS